MDSNFKVGRKAPTMVETYDKFETLIGGRIKLFTEEELYYVEVCRGLHCDKMECRIACGILRFAKLNKKTKQK
jgi:hypothetical protein